jgi:hypothetical protein
MHLPQRQDCGHITPPSGGEQMTKSPDPKDPEGTDSMSEKENKARHDAVARGFLGLPTPPTDNPEGVPGNEGKEKK